MPPQPSRRAVLRAAGLVAAAGLVGACTSEEAPPPASPPTADERVRGSSAHLEEDLAGLAQRTAQRHPQLAVAAAAAEAHRAHAAALRETLVPSPTPSAVSSEPSVAGSAAAAARALAKAEQAAAQRHRSALVQDGVTGEVARLLASVAGSDDAFALRVRRSG